MPYSMAIIAINAHNAPTRQDMANRPGNQAKSILTWRSTAPRAQLTAFAMTDNRYCTGPDAHQIGGRIIEDYPHRETLRNANPVQ